MKKINLILWGFHPIFQKEPIKLCVYSKKELKSHLNSGWVCEAYKEGEEPKNLRSQATVSFS